MNLEIERKFLVKNTSFIEESFQKTTIQQGFLNSNKNRTVRIRIANNKSFLTIKGLSSNSGTTRYEWEKEIPLEEGKELLLLCESGIIEKTRYFIRFEKHIYEVDIFKGENEGLILAELELNSENEIFQKPHWLGKEVTGKINYYNSYLSKNPYKKWA